MIRVARLKEWAQHLKNELIVLYFAYQEDQTPWYAKTMAFVTVAYALSPIDFIPDFIPIIGYLDDLILVPLGIYLSLKMIPSNIIEDCREKAKKGAQFNMKLKWIGMAFIIFIWILIVLRILCYIA